MPQFAVNSQLATRNPEPAVLLSPQGRVGTWVPSIGRMSDYVAVPSRSGRDQWEGVVLQGSGELSPSPQGRVGTRPGARKSETSEWSPSPQGRVGTNYRPALVEYFFVAVPSRSGRDTERALTAFDFLLRRRPLKVGSGRQYKLTEEDGERFRRRPLKVGSGLRQNLGFWWRYGSKGLAHFPLKFPPRLFSAFKVLKTA